MIDSYSFGRIVINGNTYEDIKIIKDNIKPWYYIEHHTVTEQDVVEVFEDIDFVVVGTGASGLVHVKEEVISLAESRGIKLIIEPTERACESYNKLKKQGKKVNAIMHSTC